MDKKYDFGNEWKKIQKNLTLYGKEALKLAKKGEKEIVKFSREGKLRIDAATLGLKQEQLYHAIGKEYVKTKCPGKKTPKLKKAIDELHKTQKRMKNINLKIKSSMKRKKK